jgi:hypothetical protein
VKITTFCKPPTSIFSSFMRFNPHARFLKVCYYQLGGGGFKSHPRVLSYFPQLQFVRHFKITSNVFVQWATPIRHCKHVVYGNTSKEISFLNHDIIGYDNIDPKWCMVFCFEIQMKSYDLFPKLCICCNSRPTCCPFPYPHCSNGCFKVPIFWGLTISQFIIITKKYLIRNVALIDILDFYKLKTHVTNI